MASDYNVIMSAVDTLADVLFARVRVLLAIDALICLVGPS